MGLGLGISVDWASLVPYYAKVASAFAARVKADGGTVENTACLKKDLKALNPIEPTGYLLTDYPGAAAAYSLRLINKTYAGSAIRVRRATDNAEQNIGFASKQLDTETLESFVNSGEAFTDPDITSSYNWTKGANTTYNAATEALDLLNENGLTARQGVSVSGHTYTITIVLDSVTSGGIKIYAGGTQSAVISTAGTHTLEITASNSNNILGINPSGAATCSISRFSAIDTTADAFVTTWYDQSGNGVNATQSAASAQPKIVNYGSTILENGKPIVTAKTNQTNVLDINISYSGSNLLSVFSALKLESGNNWYLSADNGSTTSPDGVFAWAFSDQLGAYRSQFAIGPDLSLGQYLLSNVWQPSIFESYVNGSLNHNNSSSDLIANFDFSILQMFQSTPSDVGIQEMVVYTSDESTNQSGIETNINDFYSIY